MKIFILIVIMHVNSGSIINFQEFNSLKQCNYAVDIIYKNSEGNTYKAVCIEK